MARQSIRKFIAALICVTLPSLYVSGYFALSTQKRYQGMYWRFVNIRRFQSDGLVSIYQPMAWIEAHTRIECTTIESVSGNARTTFVSPHAWARNDDRGPKTLIYIGPQKAAP